MSERHKKLVGAPMNEELCLVLIERHLRGETLVELGREYGVHSTIIRYQAQAGAEILGVDWEEAKALSRESRREQQRPSLHGIEHAPDTTDSRGFKFERAEQWTELYLEGYSPNEIGAEFEMPASVVRSAIQTYAGRTGQDWAELKERAMYRRQNGFGKTD